ncbi:hypothetical protein EJ04DRAFT_251027 [Polyplosphaeria fusca]|uniref:Zn(2)-C6 fungal-type domain-containing protein n=1 Tax=Polyplosphaeria fusca TaxID=682080 RepID=A0A9P4V3D3_9PLEO|nr:hypothetical protein EJ04DRAFT_251027 [Polyplosphaeria fusca]
MPNLQVGASAFAAYLTAPDTDTRLRIRHKKCDELRPACTPCSSTGRKCDFKDALASLTHSVPHLVTRYSRSRVPTPFNWHFRRDHLNDSHTIVDRLHFDYFREVSAIEYALYFDSPIWTSLVLQLVHSEPSIYHLALAVSALSRNNYHPINRCSTPNMNTLENYASMHYGRAIRILNDTLDDSHQSAELAALASILFFHFESLQGVRGSAQQIIHVQGGLAIVRSSRDSSYDTYMEHLAAGLQQLELELLLWTRL